MDWQNDWLYKLIFKEARAVWKSAVDSAESATLRGDKTPPPAALRISQYANADFDEADCLSPIERQWVFDGESFREIIREAVTVDSQPGADLAQATESLFLLPNRQVEVRGHLLAEGDFSFCISPDRKRVLVTPTWDLGMVWGPAMW